MRDGQPRTIYRQEYQSPEFLIDETHLHVALYEDDARVESRLLMRRNPDGTGSNTLQLHGQELELMELALDDVVLDTTAYSCDKQGLQLEVDADQFEVRCVTRTRPQDNTSLEGLYKSRTMFCTQCEAEGFRKITYYLDRPDVMSVFTVTLEADRQYPVLLCNGNLIESGEDESRHWTRWHDPFPKPSYLFALVAGDLECIQDSFTTSSGRDVSLRIYVEAKDTDKCDHAMLALKNSMRWDEDVFGREYDLDLFNIVAVDDFNMGAMENKSLNIFNTSCVLANPATTTDMGFQRVEGVVAHEYFHNWSGNRVTCRDWFQLSLKEGFTVYRDAEFSSDMGSRTVKRVESVSLLRTVQFAEDAGPMAHPIRPDSFIEISNFYTITVYEKGSEVVRMIRTLLGPEDFRKGSDLYFERHDGQAVTCEDFVLAMEAASGRDLGQFRRWYSQAGTPRLQVSGDWDEQKSRYTLHVSQSCPATPGQQEKQAFHIPLEVALLGDSGDLPLRLLNQEQDKQQATSSRVLEITEAEQSFVFTGVSQQPVPSLLRGFSAPVKLEFPYSREQLAVLMSRDSDGFCRWDASQQLAVAVINDMRDGATEVDERLLNAYTSLLADTALDPAMVAEMLRLPTENYLAEIAPSIDVDAIHGARESVRSALSEALLPDFLQRYDSLTTSEAYRPDAQQVAARSLRNACLAYLAQGGREEGLTLAMEQFYSASNMTDQLAALTTVVNNAGEDQRQQVLADFHRQWQHESLVVNQWFQVQAMCPLPDNLTRVHQLLQHADFSMNNPNKVRALVGAFCSANPVNFHAADGGGYNLLVETVSQLNSRNPQLAARLLTPLTRWRRYALRGEQMRGALQQLSALPDLSRDVYEVLEKSLQ